LSPAWAVRSAKPTSRRTGVGDSRRSSRLDPTHTTGFAGTSSTWIIISVLVMHPGLASRLVYCEQRPALRSPNLPAEYSSDGCRHDVERARSRNQSRLDALACRERR